MAQLQASFIGCLELSKVRILQLPFERKLCVLKNWALGLFDKAGPGPDFSTKVSGSLLAQALNSKQVP